jgi:hypothetical protein
MGNIFTRPAALWCATAALTALAFGASAGQQPAAPPLPDKKLSYRDITLTVHARKALGDDPELGALNLGVRVQDNVAVLWGPAPSDELKRRAVEVVKKVKGVHEVRDADVYIAAARPAGGPPIPPPPDEPTRTESASPNPDPGTPGALTAKPDAEAPIPVVVLCPPSPAEGPPLIDGLAPAVEVVRRGDPRFAALDCRVEGDVVTLSAGQSRPGDVMAFARAISHLPGLSRIVVLADDARPR